VVALRSGLPEHRRPGLRRAAGRAGSAPKPLTSPLHQASVGGRADGHWAPILPIGHVDFDLNGPYTGVLVPK
jgi:hypothetical protein